MSDSICEDMNNFNIKEIYNKFILSNQEFDKKISEEEIFENIDINFTNDKICKIYYL